MEQRIRTGVLILPAASWRQAGHCWRHVEELGFAHAWTYDHIAWRDLVGRTWFSSMPTLAAASAVTRRIGLGTLVSSPNFRHPVSFAKEVVTLSDISGGRFTVGLGAGAGGADAEVLGGRPWSPAERAARFAEFVELTDLLLREPVVDFDGRYYRARRARADPSGRARGQVAFAIAATGPRGMRLAARHADIWVTNGTSSAPGLVAPAASPELVREQVERLREVCADEGRDPATLRTLLLNVDRARPAWTSLEAFRDAMGRYAEAGLTDMVIPWPRDEPPFAGDPAVLEEIAAWAGLRGPDQPGLVTERSEGIRQHSPPGLPPTKEGS